ncbi:MAG: hypothetical protein ACLVDP_20235 [Flavonifractor plautii]
MKRTMRKWFYFDGSDAKTAEAWLNRLGAEGWRLGRLSTWTACFWQTGGEGTLRRDDKAAGGMRNSAPSAGTRAGDLAQMAGRLVEACIPPCPVIG